MVLKSGGTSGKSHPVLKRAGFVHSSSMSRTIEKVISKNSVKMIMVKCALVALVSPLRILMETAVTKSKSG